MKNGKACCFTGHRIIGSDFKLDVLRRGIRYLIQQGIDTFIAGGALGFDTLCAIEVLSAKQEFPNIKLHIYAPCKNQCESWHSKDKQIYNDILAKADYVDIPDSNYYNGCMKERNYKMVDNSDYCICYLNKKRSGTWQTYRYAVEKGLTVFNLAGKE
ncbi:MAG: DUF1273 family protein [Clostridia bacterium]|nr:DUF1273 family protein [Clostridia bacterium]